MGKGRLNQVQQDKIVGELVEGLEFLSEKEIDDLYNQLDVEHQMQVDQSIREFADNAVGSKHWDSDQ